MIELEVNGLPIVMKDDASIGLTVNNQILKRQGSHSIPFPVSREENEATFNFFGRLEAKEWLAEFPFFLRHCGLPFLKGETWIESVGDKEYGLALKSEKTSFFGKYKDKYLDEIDLGGETNSGLSSTEVYDKWNHTLDVPTAEAYICFPVYAPNFYEEGSKFRYWHPSPYINAWNFEEGKMTKDLTGGGTNVVCQHMRVKHMIEKIIAENGYTVGIDEIFGLAEFNKLCLISMNKVVGYFNIQYNRNVPHLKVGDFFDALEKWAGITLEVDELKQTVNIRLRKNLFTTPEVQDITDKIIDFPRSKIDPLMDGYIFNYKSDDDELKSEVKEMDEDYINSYASKEDLPTPSISNKDYLYYITSTDRYFTCVLQEKENEEDPDVWKWEEAGALRPVKKDGGKRKMEIEADILLTHVEDVGPIDKSYYDYSDQEWKDYTFTEVLFESPKTSREGNSLWEVWYEGLEMKEFPLMFSVYRVKETITASPPNAASDPEIDMPLASYDVYKEDETLIDGAELSLKMAGVNGVYENFRKEEAEWWERRRPFIRRMLLNTAEYKQLDFSKHFQVENIRGVIEGMKMDLGSREEFVVEAEMWTI